MAFSVEHRAGSFGDLIRDDTIDLSLGGMFLKSDAAYALGDEVRFRIVTEREGGVIEGTARVVRVQQAGPNGPAGVGLEFLDLVEPNRSMIEKLVELHLRARAAG